MVAILNVPRPEYKCVSWQESEDPGEKQLSLITATPDWNIGSDGIDWAQEHDVLQAVCRVPRRGNFRLYTDVWDEIVKQRRLRHQIKLAVLDQKDPRVYEKALANSLKTMDELEMDHIRMNDVIVTTINGIEFNIGPSALAPPAPSTVASVAWDRPSLLAEIKNQVKRDNEKARRLARQAEAAEKERLRLERKAIKVGKKGRDPDGSKAIELQQAVAKIAHKQARLRMEPWEAVLTATNEELDEILTQTFTLFDVDGSRSMDFGEFEKAMESMGITGQSDLLLALLRETDSDGSGEIELNEFKVLAAKMIDVAKEVKHDARKKKELQVLNRRRKAAGLPPLARLPPAKNKKTEPATPKISRTASTASQGKFVRVGSTASQKDAPLPASFGDEVKGLMKDVVTQKLHNKAADEMWDQVKNLVKFHPKNLN
jgi:hypothetical protein